MENVKCECCRRFWLWFTFNWNMEKKKQHQIRMPLLQKIRNNCSMWRKYWTKEWRTRDGKPEHRFKRSTHFNGTKSTPFGELFVFSIFQCSLGATHTPPTESNWFILMVFLCSLFLAMWCRVRVPALVRTFHRALIFSYSVIIIATQCIIQAILTRSAQHFGCIVCPFLSRIIPNDVSCTRISIFLLHWSTTSW